MADPPNPTIISELYILINSIQSQLSLLPTTGPTSHLLHPLGPIPPPFLPPTISASLDSIRSSANSLQHTLQSHTSAAPPPPSSKPAADPVRGYLALLGESATSLSSLSQASSSLAQAKLAYDRATADALPELPSWDRSLTGVARSLAVLEAIGKGVGLEAYHDPSETGPTAQISLGGKCTAVDITIDSGSGAVVGTKVSYFLPEPIGHREDEHIAAELKTLLSTLDAADPGSDARLQSCMSVLREVRRLDVLAESTGRDAFRQATAFAGQLKQRVASLEAAVLVPTGSSVAPQVVFHASPLARACPEWEAAEAGGWREREAMEAVLEAGGAHAVRVALEEAAPEGTEPPAARFHARFSPPVPITKHTGKRIHNLLNPALDDTAADPAASDAPTPPPPASPEQAWFEDLLASAPQTASEPLTRFESADVYEVPLDGAGFTPSFRLAGAGTVPGFLCTDVRVGSADELAKVLEILNEQLMLTDLLESVFAPEFRVAAAPAAGLKAKAAPTAPLDLDALFAAPAHRTLPVHLHLSPSSAAPSVALSFPAPHVPPHAAFPVTITFAIRDGALRASLDVPDTPEGHEVRSKLGTEGLERVVAATGDLGLVMRWVGSRLGGQ